MKKSTTLYFILAGLLLMLPASVFAQCEVRITYPVDPICTLSEPVPVTLTGAGGGTFTASPTGLAIDLSTGMITPETSLPGSYKVVYTVGPSEGCERRMAITLVNVVAPVIPIIQPIHPICINATPPALPTFTSNGIHGTWSPAMISTDTAGAFTYTFTPDIGQCAHPVVLTILITTTDTIPPTVTCPANILIDCTKDYSNIVTGMISAVDNCDPEPVITYTDSIIDTDPCSITVFRTWTCTDYSGNTTTCTQTITMEDITSPVFSSIPESRTVDCNAIPEPDSLIATDNCLTNPETTFMETSNVVNCSGTILRVWKATDACGNTAMINQIITVVPATGIENQADMATFKIYPSPNNGTFHFDYQPDNGMLVRLSVLDMTGRVLVNQIYSDGTAIREIIRIPESTPGIYLVRIISGPGVEYQKIIVE
jgi:hypothetical protein